MACLDSTIMMMYFISIAGINDLRNYYEELKKRVTWASKIIKGIAESGGEYSYGIRESLYNGKHVDWFYGLF